MPFNFAGTFNFAGAFNFAGTVGGRYSTRQHVASGGIQVSVQHTGASPISTQPLTLLLLKLVGLCVVMHVQYQEHVSNLTLSAHGQYSEFVPIVDSRWVHFVISLYGQFT